jgi:bacteriocin-like protein
MAKIKIKDIPKDKKISEKELKKVTGGMITRLPIVVAAKGGCKWASNAGDGCNDYWT